MVLRVHVWCLPYTELFLTIVVQTFYQSCNSPYLLITAKSSQFGTNSSLVSGSIKSRLGREGIRVEPVEVRRDFFVTGSMALEGHPEVFNRSEVRSEHCPETKWNELGIVFLINKVRYNKHCENTTVPGEAAGCFCFPLHRWSSPPWSARRCQWTSKRVRGPLS